MLEYETAFGRKLRTVHVMHVMHVFLIAKLLLMTMCRLSGEKLIQLTPVVENFRIKAVHPHEGIAVITCCQWIRRLCSRSFYGYLAVTPMLACCMLDIHSRKVLVIRHDIR